MTTPPAVTVGAARFADDLARGGRRRGFAAAAAVIVGPGSKASPAEIVAMGPGSADPVTIARRAMKSGAVIAMLYASFDDAWAAEDEINRALSEGGA